MEYEGGRIYSVESPAWEAILTLRLAGGNSPAGKVLDDPCWLAGLGGRWPPMG